MIDSDAQQLGEILQRHYLFSALSSSARDRLAASAQALTLDPEETLFRQGDASQHFFYLADGQLKLFGIAPNGDEKVVEIITPGQTFAEAVMFMKGAAYPVFAQTLTASKIFQLPNRQFIELLEADPATCLKIMASLSKRLHGRLQDVLTLTQKNATHRVVRYLMGILPTGAEPFCTIQLPAPKQVIASRLALTPETLSRVFANLAKEGVVVVEGRTLRVLSVKQLEAFE